MDTHMQELLKEMERLLPQVQKQIRALAEAERGKRFEFQRAKGLFERGFKCLWDEKKERWQVFLESDDKPTFMKLTGPLYFQVTSDIYFFLGLPTSVEDKPYTDAVLHYLQALTIEHYSVAEKETAKQTG